MEKTQIVPCNGCQACCKSAAIPLYPEKGDIVEDYETTSEIGPDGELRHRLKRQSNGDCIYLGLEGCTIYERRPAICRGFDCRVLFLRFDSRARKAMIRVAPERRAIFQAGKARLHTLRQREHGHDPGV